MITKLIQGKYSLKETFWKFGVFGLSAVVLVTYIFKIMLLKKLNGVGLLVYYTHYFSPLHIDNKMLLLTIGYILAAFVLCAYALFVFLGVWRSSAEYEKSVWIRYIAIFLTAIAVYLSLTIAF